MSLPESIASENLLPEMLPLPDADWEAIWPFALTYPGYERDDFDVCDKVAASMKAATLDELRGALFFKQRMIRHVGEDVTREELVELNGLIDEIRQRLSPQMQRIRDATEARFIKLGQKGQSEKACIEAVPGKLVLGFHNPYHDDCLRGDFERTRQHFEHNGNGNAGAATRAANQVRDFYKSGGDVIWITFYNRMLYWCFATKTIVEDLPDADGKKDRIRFADGMWRNTSLAGKPLAIEGLSGRLTKVQGFRGTICNVREFDYLQRTLLDELSPTAAKLLATRQTLVEQQIEAIKTLHWKDFEHLCDLLFANAGWRRLSAAGGTEKFIDLDLQSPVTKRRLSVQIKSSATQNDFLRYKQAFLEHEQYQELYFIVHTPKSDYREWSSDEDEGVTVWGPTEISDLCVTAGLTDWLIEQCA